MSESIESLADFLVSEARLMERGSEATKKEAKEQVPDRIKDAPALARELRWRSRLAAGHFSDAEDEPKAVNGAKRKLEETSGPVLFRNFQPRKWDQIIDRPTDEESQKIATRKPESLEGWTEAWVDKMDLEVDGEGGEADVSRRRTVIVKARLTETGLERQRIERVVENWVWVGDSSSDVTPIQAE